VQFTEEEKGNMLSHICGVKVGESLHPGRLLIVPNEMEIGNFTPLIKLDGGTEITQLTYEDLGIDLLRIDVLKYSALEILETLQEKTGVQVNEINFAESGILGYLEELDTLGLTEFNADFSRMLLANTTPKSFSDLLKLCGFGHGTNVWVENGEYLIAQGMPLSELPTVREDIMNDLLRIGVDRERAFAFSEKVRKGILACGRVRENEILEYKEMVQPLGEWYFKYCSNIRYMFPKAHTISYVLQDVYLAWYKRHYEKEFIETIIK
jgi:DNA polymerase-3 subunit alpha (Gram-positive type)